MNFKKFGVALVGALSAMLLYSAPASAQATRTWVSGVGDDANPCSRTAPCKTFAGAISKTAAGGIINCLDPGGYGAVTISKSITIDCYWQPAASILASATTGIIINTVSSTDKVVIRGLQIEGAGTTPGTRGIAILNAATVLIDHCRIAGFRTAPRPASSSGPPAIRWSST